MESVQYVFRIIQLVVTIAVMSMAGLLMLTVLPVKGNVKVLTVLSGSMEPSIKTGSIVIVKPADRYTSNDVITFGTPGREKELVTHRIVAAQAGEGGKQFLTKGDANEEADSWKIDQSAVVGKVWWSIPYLGYLSTWIKQPLGFVAVIVLPAAVLIYGELVAVKNEIVKMWLQRSKKLLVFSSLFLLTGLGMLKGGTQANMLDREVSLGNVIGVGTCYRESCVSPTPTLTEDPIEEPPVTIDVVLNEFVANGTGSGDADEWIEIYNRDAVGHDLSGWKLKDTLGETATYVFPEGTFVEANEWLVFTRQVTGITLNNSRPGDGVVLLSAPEDTVVDTHSYSVAPGENVSIGRETDGGLPWKNCTLSTQGSTNNGGC